METLRRKVLFGLFAVVLTITAALTMVNAQVYTDLYDFNPTTDGSACVVGVLAQGQDGSLYGTLCDRGANDVGVVFKVTPTGTFSILYNFDTTHGSTPKGGLTLGVDGNLYGTTQLGGTYNAGTIFQITPREP